MFKKPTTLTEFILKEEKKYKQATGTLTLLLTHIENGAKLVASHVRKSGLGDILGSTQTKNVFQEEQKKLDLYSNHLLTQTVGQTGLVYAVCSEEMKKPKFFNKNGQYNVFFDPLDGSSNIDVNISLGIIFSIYKKTNNLLQPGKNQVAAGYFLFGSSTVCVYTTGNGINGFIYDPAVGSFFLSNPNIKIPPKGKIYSINESYLPLFSEQTQKYLKSIKEKSYKSRYVGAMVADVHRIILKGGIFLYPETKKHPQGKLRLMYEVNPFAMLLKQAGGKSISNGKNPLDIKPNSIHQTVPIIMGGKKDIELYQKIIS